MRIAIYSRVSTTEQDTNNQLLILREWANLRNYQITDTYEEEESAWRSGHQRQLSSLLQDANKRKFDAVIVWAFDRLSREGPLAILTLVNKLKLCGVKVMSYQEGWTEAPGELGELLFALAG